jgi:small subunit ribosomal protein S6
MLNLSHEYETIYVLKPELAAENFEKMSAKIQGIIVKFDGEVLLLDDWGKRKLAYPIQKNARGHYVCLSYVGPSSLVGEIERQLRIEEDLLRFLTIRVGEDIDVASRRAEVAVLVEQRAKEAAIRAEEEAAAAAEAEALAAEEAKTAEAPTDEAPADEAVAEAAPAEKTQEDAE